MKNNNLLIEKFKNSTEFYKKKLQNCNTIDYVPLTYKQELIESQVKYKPYGLFTDYKYNIHQVYRTSGTTSTPLLLSFTKNDIELITTIGKECFEHSGMGSIGNNEVVINCLNLSMWAGGFFDAQAMIKTGVQVINFGTGNTIELIKLILSYNKNFKVSLHCTPSYLPIIEKRLKKEFNLHSSDLNLHSLYLGAEGGVQNNNFRNEIIQSWNCNVYNANYGMSEVCSIMASASEDNVLKFSKLFLKKYKIELLDSKTIIQQEELQQGVVGDLIVTSLHKESQPLFKYHTKERIQIAKNIHNEIYFEIVGRSDDMIVYKGINFFPEQIRSLILSFKELTGIYKIQVEKKQEIIVNLNLVCELKKEIKFNEEDLKNIIEKKIRHEFTIKLNVSFTNSLIYKGNKLKTIEIINLT